MGLRAVGRRLLAGGVLAAGKRSGRGGEPRQGAGDGFAGSRAAAFVWRGLAAGKRPGEGGAARQRAGDGVAGPRRRLLSGGRLSAGKRPGEGGAAPAGSWRWGCGPSATAFVWRGAFGWEAARRRQGSWQYGVPVQTAGGRAQKERRRGGGRGPPGPAIAAEGSGEPVGVGGASARCLPGGEPQLLPYRQRGAPGGGRTGPFSRCGCGEKRSSSPNRQNPGVCCRKMQHFRVFYKKNTENLRFIHK